MTVILASASPRRRALLEGAGLRFGVEPSGVDEELEGEPTPEEAARALAARKARHVAARHVERRAWVVGTDTVVAVAPPGASPAWRLLGKPADEAEARGMLRSLAGTRHVVVTGVCVVRTPDGARLVESETTWVTMRALEEPEVRAYVATGEWRDKAGGYAIQETADAFVERLEGGGFDNVVGLPVRLTLGLLARLGAPGLPETVAEPRPRG